MKKYIYLLCSLLMLFSACQQEQNFSNENIGYLRLDLGVNTSAVSRTEDVPYNPKQLAVQIVAEDGEIVKQTNDWTEWEGQQIALPVGTYTLKASSAGFDGMTSGFDKPYYAGSAEINIEKDKEVNETVTCTLANVKVTVIFDQSFVDAFKEAKVTVDDNADDEGISALDFVMGQENKSAYFPVTDLKAVVNVVNKQDVSNSQTNVIENVQPRDHYILTYKVGEITGGDVSISIDPTTRTYTYNFTVSTLPKTTLTATANAWSKFAYLEGTAVTTETLEPTQMVMQYRQKNTEEWTPLATALEGETYKAKAEGLTPDTEYECRMVYGEEEYVSEVAEFTTETAVALYNGNFDLWTTSGETIYPGTSEEAGNTTSFWNTSNPGTSQGIGAMGGAINPTTYVTSPVHTSGEGAYAAKLESTYKIIKFAAASLYTGNFLGLSGMSANMEFGKPFTGRPIALHGFYKYTPKVINRVDRKPAGVEIIKDQTMDQCAIFIALAKKSFTFNNNKEEEYIDYEGDDNIIAYGELPSGEATSGDGYTEFSIPLKYKNLTDKPTHIIVVCSASKYGDYMTGGEGSLLYVDDFELVYDGEPSLQE